MTAREMLEGQHPTPDQYQMLLEIDIYGCTAKRWALVKHHSSYAAVEARVQAEHAAHWAFQAFPDLRDDAFTP